jgi:hypothetical protein
MDFLDDVTANVYRKLPPQQGAASVLPARGGTPEETAQNVLAWTRDRLFELKPDRQHIFDNILKIMPEMQSMIVDVRYTTVCLFMFSSPLV